MNTTISAWALSCALLGAPIAAFADQTASASITDLRFDLQDLAPDDGVAASLTQPPEFVAATLNSTANAAIVNFGGQQVSQWLQGTAPLADVSASALYGPSTAQASLTGNGTLLGPYQLWASGNLVDTPSGDYLTTDFSTMSARAGTDDGSAVSFLLSAHTSVTLSGKADLFISTSGANSNVSVPFNTVVSGKFLVRFDAPWAGGSPFVGEASKELILGYREEPSTDAFSQNFSFSYVNDTDQSTMISLWASTSVYGMLPHSPASAIPEPGSFSLMALGLLGLLGTAAARRR